MSLYLVSGVGRRSALEKAHKDYLEGKEIKSIFRTTSGTTTRLSHNPLANNLNEPLNDFDFKTE